MTFPVAHSFSLTNFDVSQETNADVSGSFLDLFDVGSKFHGFSRFSNSDTTMEKLKTC